MKHKLLVIGHGRHGKDTVCEILRDEYGYTFQSSSQFCNKLFIYNNLKNKYGYTSEAECYADRHNHREEWYNEICDYVALDLSKLGREMFNAYNIYCGLRNKREFLAMKKANSFDYVIWVDRSMHLPPEDKNSMDLEQSMADYIIDNNGDLLELKRNVRHLIKRKLSKTKLMT